MATIAKANYSEVTGKVVKVSNQEITLGFTNGVKGVETNIWVTIEDELGMVHTGSLVKKKSEKKLA